MDMKAKFQKGNEQIRKTFVSVRPKSILLALSYEVQSKDCHAKIDTNIGNCPDCSCAVGVFRAIAEDIGIAIQITSECTLENRYIDEYRPDLIVYVGPDAELQAVMKRVRRIPVYCIPFPQRALVCPPDVRRTVEECLSFFCT